MRHTPFSDKYFILALVPLAVILIAIGLFLTIDYKHFRSNAVVTMGWIKKEYVHEDLESDRYNSCDVLVAYKAGDNEYHLYISNYEKGRKVRRGIYEGRGVEVMYDKNHPAESRTTEEPYRKSMLIVGAGVLSLLLSFHLYRRNHRYDRIIRNGIIIDATVTEVVAAYSDSTNVFSHMIDKLFSHGMSPAVNYGKNGKILCEWINPVSGKVYKFSSLAMDNAIRAYIGKSIKVYVDPNDYSKYYVDVDSVIKQPIK